MIHKTIFLKHNIPYSEKCEFNLHQFPQYKQFTNVAMEGSFDHLHFAHKVLLFQIYLTCTLFFSSYKISIMITTNEIIPFKQKFFAIQPIYTRHQGVEDFINLICNNIELNVI